jgi:hypothetical protein
MTGSTFPKSKGGVFMKGRIMLGGLLASLALVALAFAGPVRAYLAPQQQVMEPAAQPPIADLHDLLNAPYDVHIEDLYGEAREVLVTALLQRDEARQLKIAMAEKGFAVDPSRAEAMVVTVDSGGGTDQVRTIEVAVVPMGPIPRIFLPLIMRDYTASAAHLAHSGGNAEPLQLPPPEELSAYLVAMVADDDTTFFQAHHTNLDPKLAEVPDPPIIYNDMPYFYITTLQIVKGRIVFWHYWWFDSHHHPNWYYSAFFHYWGYYAHVDWPWPWWHHWGYGWYYWRFWYFWSTYFPWAAPPVP